MIRIPGRFPQGAAAVWIFDLDNTLHDARPHIFPHINRSMTAYLQQHLQLSETAADALRLDYWRRYGATLTGLIRHHGIDPDHFLWHTHQFPYLPGMVQREPRLRAALRRLPGRRLVYSNAPEHYARAVLQVLKVADLFDAVFSIEDAGYFPKPQRRGFLALLRKFRLVPQRCIMVEDSVENLLTAKRLGMRTVWISRAVQCPPQVDVKIKDVLELPRLLARMD